MVNFLLDETMVIYLCVLLVSIYGSGLFLWWWIKRGEATNIYAYVTLIFIGETIETGIVGWSRYLVLSGLKPLHEIFQGTIFWPARKVVLLIALTLIVVRMTYRLVRNGGNK
jgi:hypothetical protein